MKPSKLICNLNEFFLILSVSELKDFFLKKAKKERGSLSYSTRGRTRAINSWAFFTLLWGGECGFGGFFQNAEAYLGWDSEQTRANTSNNSSKYPHLSFHSFPATVLVRNEWFCDTHRDDVAQLGGAMRRNPSQKNQLSFLKLSSLGSFLLTSSSYCFFNSYNGLASRSGHIPASCLVLPGQAEVVHVHKGRQ